MGVPFYCAARVELARTRQRCRSPSASPRPSAPRDPMADTAESMHVDVGGTASGLDGPRAFVTNEPAAATSACVLAVPMVGHSERSLSPSVVLADAAAGPLSTATTAVAGVAPPVPLPQIPGAALPSPRMAPRPAPPDPAV